MMRRVLVLLLVLLLIFNPLIVLSQVKCEEALVVNKPCIGILLPEEDASEGLRCLEVDLPKLELDYTKQIELLKLDVLFLNEKLEIESSISRSFQELLKLSITTEVEVEEPSFLESPILWSIIGVAVGAGISIGVFYAIK